MNSSELQMLSQLNLKDDGFMAKIHRGQKYIGCIHLNKDRLDYLSYLKEKCRMERSGNNSYAPSAQTKELQDKLWVQYRMENNKYSINLSAEKRQSLQDGCMNLLEYESQKAKLLAKKYSEPEYNDVQKNNVEKLYNKFKIDENAYALELNRAYMESGMTMKIVSMSSSKADINDVSKQK